MTRARLLRWLGGSALILTAGVGLIGFAHTPAGRPLLNALRGAPGCPVELDGGDPAALESQRIAALEPRRGSQPERGRPALGFELGHSRKADVLARMHASGSTCESIRGGSALRCTDVSASFSGPGAPAIDDLHIQFNADDQLVAVDLFRASMPGEEAMRWLDQLADALTLQVGPPTAKQGALRASELDGYLRRAVLEYHYQGYVAQLSAMNTGKRGIRVHEQYQWLPAPTHAG